MNVPEYVSVLEVRRVCKDLGISDWTKRRTSRVSMREARRILSEVQRDKTKIDIKEFCRGLEVELEHGMEFKDANVTNNHPLLTGLIVLAHFKESLDYYSLLEVAELEGDLIKAIAQKDAGKTRNYYKRLAKARIALGQAELVRLR